jgi:tetratricopeptide (TPR) repeat protein
MIREMQSNSSDSTEESQSSPQISNGLCDFCSSMLFASLDPISQKLLCNAAVYSIPININGLEYEALGPYFAERADLVIGTAAEEWNRKALASKIRSDYSTDKIAIRKKLRIWLMDRMSDEEKGIAHEAAGDFYQKALLDKSCSDLEISSFECSLEARSHYLLAGVEKKALDATNRISGILMARGFYGEVIRQNEELLGRFDHPMTMRWIARALFEQGDLQKAANWYQRCQQSPARSKEDESDCLHGIAAIELRLGRYEKAKDYLKMALEACKNSCDERGQADILRDLSLANAALGDYASAREDLNRALEIQRKSGDLAAISDALKDLIAIDLRLKDRDAAHKRMEEALEIFRRLGRQSDEASTLYDLASLDMEKGEYDPASARFQKVLEIRRRIGDRSGEAATLHSLAMIDAQKQKLSEAGEKFKAALLIYQEIGDKAGESAAFFQLGILGIVQNHSTEGMRLLALSGIILRSIGSDEVKNVEPVIERMASQLRYTQDQFAQMIQQAAMAYRSDRGLGLVQSAIGG